MENFSNRIERAYDAARDLYAAAGVDTEQALQALAQVPISIQCWQGDDVAGFEHADALSGGGIQATGNYPGKARTGDELRGDFSQMLRFIPGRHRINLHAIYAETNGKKVERDRLGPEHFGAWLEWAREEELGVDFNPTFFAHPLADSGFTLSHRDPALRAFWIDHGKACRRIAAWFGRELGTPCVNNVWIPDGYKDLPADRLAPRRRLMEALDLLFEEPIDTQLCLDAVEAKLFGIGSESYVVGSHEFYMGYAVLRHKLLCLDAGHFHPTESIADKISSILLYLDEILLHVSRGVRWDSDHIVLLNDDLHAIAQELVRGGFLARVHIGLDFFDASVNRIAAWTIGTRAMIKALLCALLDPVDQLKQLEADGDLTGRLALMEESKTMPFGAVWNYYALQQGVPLERQCLEEIRSYERSVLSQRG